MSESTHETPQAEPDTLELAESVTGPQKAGNMQPADGEPPDRQQRRDERWRERARAAEARADRIVRREVLRLLSEQVQDPEAALALSQTDMTRLLTEDGDVDAEAVDALAADVLKARPYLERREPHHMDLAVRKPLPAGPSATWAGVISGR